MWILNILPNVYQRLNLQGEKSIKTFNREVFCFRKGIPESSSPIQTSETTLLLTHSFSSLFSLLHPLFHPPAPLNVAGEDYFWHKKQRSQVEITIYRKQQWDKKTKSNSIINRSIQKERSGSPSPCGQGLLSQKGVPLLPRSEKVHLPHPWHCCNVLWNSKISWPCSLPLIWARTKTRSKF